MLLQTLGFPIKTQGCDLIVLFSLLVGVTLTSSTRETLLRLTSALQALEEMMEDQSGCGRCNACRHGISLQDLRIDVRILKERGVRRRDILRTVVWELYPHDTWSGTEIQTSGSILKDLFRKEMGRNSAAIIETQRHSKSVEEDINCASTDHNEKDVAIFPSRSRGSRVHVDTVGTPRARFSSPGVSLIGGNKPVSSDINVKSTPQRVFPPNPLPQNVPPPGWSASEGATPKQKDTNEGNVSARFHQTVTQVSSPTPGIAVSNDPLVLEVLEEDGLINTNSDDTASTPHSYSAAPSTAKLDGPPRKHAVLPSISSFLRGQAPPPPSGLRVSLFNPVKSEGHMHPLSVNVTLEPGMGVYQLLQKAALVYGEIHSEGPNHFRFRLKGTERCHIIGRLYERAATDSHRWHLNVLEGSGKVVYDGECIPNSRFVSLRPGYHLSLHYRPTQSPQTSKG